jgi:hypothetical protein
MWDTPRISAIRFCMPAELLVGQPGQITVELLVRDRTAVLPETMELLGVDAAGRPQGSALATLTDDSVDPDAHKHDALFSGAWTVDTSQPRELRLRVSMR